MRNTGSEDAVANQMRKTVHERRRRRFEQQTAAAQQAGRGKRRI